MTWEEVKQEFRLVTLLNEGSSVETAVAVAVDPNPPDPRHRGRGSAAARRYSFQGPTEIDEMDWGTLLVRTSSIAPLGAVLVQI